MEVELILTVFVKCRGSVSVSGHTKDIVMIPFTGTAEGPFFSGNIIGTGTDTQEITKDGRCRLSARYMIEGHDCAGKPCRLFIENENRDDGRLRPRIVTDSKALAEWETSLLCAEIEPDGDNVTINIYKEKSARC